MCVVGEGRLQNITTHKVLHDASSRRAVHFTGTSRLPAFSSKFPLQTRRKQCLGRVAQTFFFSNFLTGQSRDNVQSDHPRCLSLSSIAHSGIIEKSIQSFTCVPWALCFLFSVVLPTDERQESNKLHEGKGADPNDRLTIERPMRNKEKQKTFPLEPRHETEANKRTKVRNK